MNSFRWLADSARVRPLAGRTEPFGAGGTTPHLSNLITRVASRSAAATQCNKDAMQYGHTATFAQRIFPDPNYRHCSKRELAVGICHCGELSL